MRARWETALFTVFALTLVVAVLYIRRDTIILRAFINPDEGDLLAGGRRAAMSLVPFKDFTSFTYGPLWPFSLGLLHRLGLPLTIPVAHLLNALVLCVACIVLVRTLWSRWNLVIAVVAVTPFAVQWAKGFNSSDFFALSTEALPFLLLVLACVVSFPADAITLRRAITGAALFGAVVWSKYSFVYIVAVGLVASIVKMLNSGIHLRRALTVGVIVPVAPLGFLASWALVFRVPGWKIIETFNITITYLTKRDIGHQSAHSLHAQAPHLIWAISRAALPLGALVVIAIGVATFHSIEQWRSGARDARTLYPVLMSGLAVASIAAAIVSLVTIMPVYAHYGYLLIAAIFQATFIAASLSRSSATTPRTTRVNAWVMVVIFIVAFAVSPRVISSHEPGLSRWIDRIESRTSWSNVLSTSGALWERASTRKGIPLSTLCPFRSKVIVWAWSPDLYSQYDWEPATRYVITTPAMVGPKLINDTHVFRPRLLADFHHDRPTCVVDAATTAMFPGWGAKYGIKTQWPEFANELKRGYTRSTVILDSTIPMVVWVRKT